MNQSPSNRLPRRQELAIYLSLACLVVTGLAWLALDQWVRVAGAFGSEHHPIQRWMLIVHAVGAYGFLFVAGSLVSVHIPIGWRLGHNRTSGVMLCIIGIVLSLSALGLYYVGNEALRGWLSQLHWIVGLGFVPALLIHALFGRSWANTDETG